MEYTTPMKFASLCYVSDHGKTLMLYRNKKPNDMHEGKWNGLGGKIESGETPEECAMREIYEESGLRVKNLKFKGILTFPQFDGKDDWYAFLFTAEKKAGKLIDSPEGTLSWMDDDQVLKLNLWEGDKIFIPWLKKPGFFSGKFIYKNGKLISHTKNFYH